MKQLLSLAICFSVCFAVKAQDNKDTTIQKAAVSICNCLEKNHVENAKGESEMQAIFLQCMIDSASQVMGDLVMNSDNGDMQQAGEEVGQKIAMELVRSGCKPFMQMSMKMAQGGNLSMGNNGNDKEDESVKTADGIVTKVEEKDFLYITVKTTAGREMNLIYLDYVDNSDDWVKDAQTKLKDRKVTVQWVEKEVYQPKLKDFSNVKMLKDLKIKKD